MPSTATTKERSSVAVNRQHRNCRKESRYKMTDLDHSPPRNISPNRHHQQTITNQASYNDPIMSHQGKKEEGTALSRGFKRLSGVFKKKSESDLRDQGQVSQPISTVCDTFAPNNPFANSEAAPPSYSEAMSGKPGGSSSIPAIAAKGNQLHASNHQDPGASTSFQRRVTLNGQVITDIDDPYAFLSIFDTVFLIDDSGSMIGQRWSEARDAIAAIAPVCVAHDKDGVDLHFLNHPRSYTNITSAAKVNQIFNSVHPSGRTLTGQRIWDILGPYLKMYTRGFGHSSWDPEKTGVKPVNLIVITDGDPQDDPESRILQVIKELERVNAPPYQIGIQFFQVGDDPRARAALAELDDELGGEKSRDMVDTVTWDNGDTRARQLEGEKMLKIVLGSVVKRLDRRPAAGKDKTAKRY
ncbi:hypothetical protein GE21DRAFT_2757 [Neurospora crassa]|uniref:von Willebrand factor n=2 Tax=Neurospora crassa TaxID=5141 RepID=Q1K4N7_NEUCR|nr:von Willebrand factor [Neurospora crassa OR74A]EAA26602.2 von Willebrand factor [Neurospora crassa OR74A]KHE79632.1 hypothetical protein GE21DRAFT_2757 [Neurospora crassa]|eukprot:XP_955838.2 von Willebrand factor [Neurospora crassa OR74A]